MDKPLQEDIEHMMTRFKNLIDETTTLKLVVETLLAMRHGVRIYAGCEEVIGHMNATFPHIQKRVDHIEVEVKKIMDLAKKQEALMKTPTEGGTQ